MLNVQEAISKIKKKFPNGEVLSCAEYGNDYYLCGVSEDGSIDNSAMYSVRKSDGQVAYFNPTADLDGFEDAFENHEIPLDKSNDVSGENYIAHFKR